MLQRVEILKENGNIVKMRREELGYSFRSSALKRGEIKGIILRAFFDISKFENKELLERKAEECTRDRKRTQDPPAHNLRTTVNCFGLRNNLRNRMIGRCTRIFTLLTSNNSRVNSVRTLLTCLIYGKPKLFNYISRKRINCWLWKDDRADLFFPDYIQMVRKMYDRVSIEIEVKG